MHAALLHTALGRFASELALGWPASDLALGWPAPGVVLHWVAVGVVLLAALAVGVAVHELLHLAPLHLADADCTVTVLPSADAPTAWSGLRSALTGGLVRVEVTRLPPTTPEWVVRGAALLPVALVAPLALVAVGALPNPVAAGDHFGTAALVAVTACGLPSPADWAVAWHGSDRAEN